jgi:hypothetical protein
MSAEININPNENFVITETIKTIESTSGDKYAGFTARTDADTNYFNFYVVEDGFNSATVNLNANGELSLTKNGFPAGRVPVVDPANDFADDAAAATGGINIGQAYHSSGFLRVRLV